MITCGNSTHYKAWSFNHDSLNFTKLPDGYIHVIEEVVGVRLRVEVADDTGAFRVLVLVHVTAHGETR